MPDVPPIAFRVLNTARGIAGAYAIRLLTGLGARCTTWNWQEPSAGEWPPSAGFRRYFESGVEQLVERVDIAALFERLPRIAARFDLVLLDLTLPELPAGLRAEGDLQALLHPYNPAIVVAHSSHYGRSGPYAERLGDEFTDYALGGYWAIAGDPDRAPLRVPGYQAQFHAGMHLALGALVALREARRSGQGQEVEVSGIEAMISAHYNATIDWAHEGRAITRTGSGMMATRDGWVSSLAMYNNLFVLIERPELAADPRFATVPLGRLNAPALREIVAAWCAEQPTAEIVERGQGLRIPVSPMANAADLLVDPQLEDRSFFTRLPDGERAGAADGPRYPGPPFRWTPAWEACESTQPLTDPERGLNAGDPPLIAVPKPITVDRRVDRGLPLSGLRVLELTNNWAGPIAGRHLADLGAEVIKIEIPDRPATRANHYPGRDPGKEHWNRSGYFNEMNRNKRAVSLDIGSERGRELFLRLVERSDVLIENNSARVMPNLGLAYPRLAEVNPRLVMASISGFGATGPRRDWVAFGSNIEAACGLAAITGYDEHTPHRTSSFIADPIAGAHAALGILAALERRDHCGRGAHLDVALTESMLPFMLESLVYVQERGSPMPRQGNIDPESAPSGAYRCAGIDNWVALAVRSDAQWRALCELAGLETGFMPDRSERLAAREQIDTLLAPWFGEQDQYACVRLLQATGIAAAPILNSWQLQSDPHLYARGVFIHIEHPSTGVLPYPGFPWRFTGTPPRVRMAAPCYAEGNDYVFRGLLGLSAVEVEELYGAGVSALEPKLPVPVPL